MTNWKILDNSEYDRAWKFVYEDLSFKPNAEFERLITIPFPNKCYDISKFYNEGFSEQLYDNLHQCAVNYFNRIAKGKRLLALNWQHECYSFDPRLPFETDKFGEWLISVFPNGDYIFFLTKAFRDGIFADGLNLTISFFGEDMIKEIESKQPEILIKSKIC